VDGRDRGRFIQPCKHLVCHSCWPQCVEKRKGSHCLLCARGHSPPDFTSHARTKELSSAANEVAPSYPSKLIALLDDIKQAPENKWLVSMGAVKIQLLTGSLVSSSLPGRKP
jgi:hypothetical protein